MSHPKHPAIYPVGAVGATGLLSLAGILAIATGTKYLWDAAADTEKRAQPPEINKIKSKKDAKTAK
ncbi:MAG: hypothetical protein B1H13_08485 [Desulfobacteraceae bacterium 4484_190.3]|nr:MAG: hypothetical protein B1H13_08485 [Desulfobacteraceae bacterium 4484_190.3]